MDNPICFVTTDTVYKDTKYTKDNTVKKYSEDNSLSYPLLLLECESIELFRIDALRGILTKASYMPLEEGSYHVYIRTAGQTIGVGVLRNTFLRAVLMNRTFAPFKKRVYIDESTCYEGVMLYGLCPPGEV